MKVRIRREEIRRVIGNRYDDLNRDFLGVDLSRRGIDPIWKNVYYVSYLDPTGWNMFRSDAPALCDFRDGSIYCYHDPAMPLTEPRLVHEFVHRAARFRLSIGVWSSGIIVNDAWSRVNEAITEYLTSLLCGERYSQIVNPSNRYLIYLPAVKRVEEAIGRDELLRAYLNHDIRPLQDFVTRAGDSGYLRFR